MWEHQFRETYRNEPDLRHYLQNLDITYRLDPLESFFGCRTNASQLYYRTKEDEKIEYGDFTSLYPWVNKTCQYPVGHPEVITSDFKDLNQCFGIAKVRILPPRGLYHPVFPNKSNEKLKFPLCQTGAKKESPSLCGCSDEDRTMTGTWCTPELQTAVRLGYRVLKIYEVYHWKDTGRRVALRTGSRPPKMPKSISIGIQKRRGIPRRGENRKESGNAGIGQALPKQFLGEIGAATEPETVPILSRD